MSGRVQCVVVCCTPWASGVCQLCVGLLAEEVEEIDRLKSENATLDKENEEYSGVCESLSVQSLLCVCCTCGRCCIWFTSFRGDG